MFSDRNTLIDNDTIKKVINNMLKEKDYEMFNPGELSKMLEVPDKYVILRARYESIYRHDTSSDFLIVNYEKKLRIRIEIKFQKTSGSVDEKLPYLYLNSVTTHEDDVLFIVEGDGFKRGAKIWLEEQVHNEWLNKYNKHLYMRDLVGGVKLLEELI